ncbi:MAG: FxSxx-COOH system tetratricopeptide repeat protein, partial [Planctomycetota bacterium]|nr:FxSxx-COOH system tetratricopeptide repeat protein [Planctomycetota bacterium]
SRHPAALTQAISGLGGVGKTQLAVQYAWQHGGEYKVVWWVRAEQPAQLAADYADLARALNLPEKDAREQEIVVEAVRKWLSINGEWLLIFDNAPDPEAVKPYLPAGRKGHVIITSRHHAWGGIAQRLDVKVLPIDDAVIFLRNRAGRPNDPDAKVLAKAMGFLPLALTQAAVYVERTGSSFARYIEILKRAEKELLASGVGAEDYDISVAAAIGLSLDKLQPASADLLILCAFLAPDDIPLDLIAAVGADLPKRLAATIADPKSFAECQGDLLSQSLIECPADGLLSVHRIVQAVVRSRLRPAQRKAWAKAAVAMMNEAFPDNIAKSPDVWPTCKRLFMHALAAASNAEGDDETLAAAAWLFNQAGEYLSLVSDLPGAKANFEKALAIDEKIFGPEHTKVAACLNNLGFVLQEQGNLPGANACFRRALAIDEKAYGLEHPDVATTVNNLGSVLVDEGDVAGAKACFQRALSIDEKTYGMDHPKLAIRTNNLGFVLDEEGNRTGAMACYQRALSIDQRTYGPNHPNVAVDLNNIGTVLVGEGNLAGAKTLFRQALGIDEEVYGREHPKVAERLNNLGWVLRLEGDLGGANA